MSTLELARRSSERQEDLESAAALRNYEVPRDKRDVFVKNWGCGAGTVEEVTAQVAGLRGVSGNGLGPVTDVWDRLEQE